MPSLIEELTTMKKDTPITSAVATYGDRAGAVNDFDGVMAAKTSGAFDHVAVAVVTKGSTATSRSSTTTAPRSTVDGVVRS